MGQHPGLSILVYKSALSQSSNANFSYLAKQSTVSFMSFISPTGKVDADSRDEDGRTPRCWAAQNGHEAVVKLLLDTGKVEADFRDKDGQTPLCWAALNGHEAIIKLLLDTDKVDANSRDKYGVAGYSHENSGLCAEYLAQRR
jgi:hypothetical protein